MSAPQSGEPEARPAPETAPTVDGSTQVGPYRLLSVLGRGGMGIVYLAEQTAPIRRRVALKVLKAGMDTEQVLLRFESERQALAVMDHAGIAKVFDSGVTDSGRSYFVMEAVHGIPITEYADRYRLTTPQRLRLFLGVCAAVQHAHLKGVVHRDLKPSNVLVVDSESGPLVKVIDFGLAKAVGIGLTEESLVTRVGQQLGTPEYMSPEQAAMSEMDVDTRTDVYSLGVMLYELIVGCRPLHFLVKPGHDLSRALQSSEVARPSLRVKSLEELDKVALHRGTTPDSLRSELKGDLDWIILKAMEKDRERRYDTVNGLALDIMHHLDHEPVRARPPSTAYRVGKFVRRNRAPVVAAAVALAAVLGGATAATVGFVHAVQERERAEHSALIAQRGSDFLADLFESSDPAEAPGVALTARDLLDRGAERIPVELADQPAVQATLLRTIGVAYHRLGAYDEAAARLEEAVALGERLADVDEMELAHALRRLGMVYRVQGRTEQAESAFERAIALLRRSAGSEAPELLSATNGLAGLYISHGRYAEATPILAQVADLQESLLGPDHIDLSATLHMRGALHLSLREAEEAMPFLERALAIRLAGLHEEHPLVARTLNNIGAGYLILEDHDRAEDAFLRAISIVERTSGPDDLDLGSLLTNLGEIHWARGRYDEAEAALLRAWRVKVNALGPENVRMPPTYRVLAHVYRDQGRLDDAEELYRSALAILDRTVEGGDPSIRETLEGLAHTLRLAGRVAEADELDARIAMARAEGDSD